MESVCWLLLASVAMTVPPVRAQTGQCGIPQGNPNTVLTEADILKDTFNNGDKATFKCTVGYVLEGGSTSVTCNDGTWTKLTLLCERKSCGSPGEVMNGVFDLSGGIEFGDTVSVTCDEGYFLAGTGERTCESAGWSGNLPLCEVVRCQPPPGVANAGPAEPSKEIYNYGDAVSYACLPGFTLDGPPSISCSSNLSFSPAPPKCIKVLCPTPDIENGQRVGGGRPPYSYRNFVTYGCAAGYRLEGASTLTCELNSKWSPPPPVCNKIPPTTTKAPSTPAKPTTPSPTAPVSGRVPDPVDPTDRPSSDGFNGWYIGGPVLAVTVVAVIGVIVYLKKKRVNRSHPIKKESKDAEVAGLSP